jgi:hypothetical protein
VNSGGLRGSTGRKDKFGHVEALLLWNGYLTSGFQQKLQHLPLLFHFAVNKSKGSSEPERYSYLEGKPIGSLKEKKGLFKSEDLHLNNPHRGQVVDQSNLWTIGQLIEKPALPNGAPPGPVNRPSWTKVNI